MSKLSVKYLVWTFIIMLLSWGTCAVCSMNGIFMEENGLLYVPYIIGGFSPTIASFFVLKQSGRVKNFLDWIKGIFDIKQKPIIYVWVLLLSVILVAPRCLFFGYDQGSPLSSIFILIPQMIFGGGLEEAGWRHILQPEMRKKYGFITSTLLVGTIWWVWHLPLFFVAGVAQYGTSFFAFGVAMFGSSFAMAAIKEKTNSTWLCVLFHAMGNVLADIYVFNGRKEGYILSSSIVILISCIWAKARISEKLAA